MKKNIKIFSFSFSLLLIVAGFFITVSLVKASASTIVEAGSPPSEMLSSLEVMAKANAVIPTTTFLLRQDSGGATLNSVVVVIVDPSASSLANTDIASVSLRKESGATSNFQVGEDLLVTGATATNPAVDGSPIILTPTTPETIGADIVQYYVVITIAASPVNDHSLAVNLGANYGVDSIGGTVGTALTATKKNYY